MNFTIKEMDLDSARSTLSWRYEPPYDFYNNEMDEESIKERLDGSYQAITLDDELFGYLCIGEQAQIPIGHKYGVYHERCVDMGLGMNPDYVGKGYGYGFCERIMNHIKENNPGVPIRLSVATFNKKAIHLYEKLGFVKKDKFDTGHAEFITMIKRN
ncbi:GNAT family N-acetyltransferase [Guptibacillus algicola]|uniref:GNAT family N-acetyltransferase n=1 Tax=Guptibacillus algicola TaxID=225844 RepID=UPI001CD375E1|nr:GNAT family protein [Alkalihalobacillus algicola]MCA0987401.1 GNAT family N-acetyltransferase [Alkalihalobacillus algicola]